MTAANPQQQLESLRLAVSEYMESKAARDSGISQGQDILGSFLQFREDHPQYSPEVTDPLIKVVRDRKAQYQALKSAYESLP